MGIPTDRVLEKLDGFFAKNDTAAAKRHLLYWLSEAQMLGDDRGALLLNNELMGLCRKLGQRDEALDYAQKALALVEKMGIVQNVGAATTYLNSATVYKAFNRPQDALRLYEKAKNIYEQQLRPDDDRLAGLYNNMALALVDLERFQEADSLYRQALSVLGNVPDKVPEMAITYLNMATAAEKQYGQKAALDALLEQAKALLESCREQTDGNYAFVCEKCATVFGYYGDEIYANDLLERSRRIYEGT